MLRKTIALVIFLSLCFVEIWAQAPCFRGKPAPECKSFWVTEFGIAAKIAGKGEGYRLSLNRSLLYFWEGGLMGNVSRKFAIGGMVYVNINSNGALGDPYLGFGLKPRVRYWMNRNFSLDVSPGLLLAATKDNFGAPAFIGSASLNYKNQVALTSSVERIRWKTYEYAFLPEIQETAVVKGYTFWYLGAKAQSVPGVIIGGVGAIVAALIALGNVEF